MTFPNKENLNIGSFLNNYSKLLSDSINSIDKKNFLSIIQILEKAIIKKKNIFTCGNGGSSAIAEHFVCDFVKGVSSNTNISPRVNSLTSNTSLLSAIANDINYEEIFSYQLNKYASKGDLLFCISSSGNSKNIINAINMASKMKIETISLVGFSGGKVKKISDNYIHIAINNYGVVEDAHQSIMHMMSQYIRLKNIDNLSEVKKIKF
jgi:phosphoheptose isomerase